MNASTLVAAADDAARRRDLPAAAGLLEQATALAPGDAAAWSRLAACYRALGRPADALAAINAALAVTPRDPITLLAKAALLEKAGNDAGEIYRAALAFLPDAATLPAPLQAQVAHARRYCARAAEHRHAALARSFDRAVAACRLDEREHARLATFAEAIGAGATTTVLPGLSRPDYFEPALFGALPAIARRHAEFTREYRALMAGADGANACVARPYVDHPDGAPLDQWAPLNRSEAWRAAHLWRGGVRVPEVADRCPVTAAAWAALPTPGMPGRAPNLMFSILAPNTAIPRHAGTINARLVVHVPLIVPRDCRMTVGAEDRAWVPGEALVFDDTIEHEAINGSDEVRVVLIGDVWHPDLSANERTVLGMLMAGPA